ncbi:MAG: amidohydrolase family protein [Bryobacteraceae bacterium]
MRLRLLVPVLLIAGGALTAQFVQAPPAKSSGPVIVIKAGKLLDPDRGATVANQIVIVEGDKIREIGTNLAIPEGARVIDLSNYTVLPGLIDSHAHMCDGVVSRRGLPRQLAKGLQLSYDLGNTTGYRAIQGVANARTMLETGFTTIRDIGNNGNYADVDLRRAIAEGLVPGPTMITAGRIIAPFGGQYSPSDRGYAHNAEHRGLMAPEYFLADTHDELKKAIRENIFFGSQVIKIVVDDQKAIYSADDIRFIAEETHRAGLKLAAHCVTEAGARNAAEGGVDSIEHGFEMSDAVLAIAKRNNVTLVGTDFTPEFLAEYGLDEATIKRSYARSLDRIRRANKLGVEQAFGSDIIFNVPGKTRGEVSLAIIDAYVEAGLPKAYILQMATSKAARLLGVDRQRGTLRPGMAADLIATTDDPLVNFETIKKVRFVMKDGVVYKQP